MPRVGNEVPVSSSCAWTVPGRNTASASAAPNTQEVETRSQRQGAKDLALRCRCCARRSSMRLPQGGRAPKPGRKSMGVTRVARNLA